LIAATLVLAAMGVFRYAQSLDTVSTPVPAVPAEYAGISLPQAMRLADQAAATTTVPAEYAGISLPQAMRLADQAAAAAAADVEGGTGLVSGLGVR
jgi:hypothetical protein